MRIGLTSVFVDDQDKALKFYTEVLGFVKKLEVPIGTDKWLTVASPEDPDGVQLLLEPNHNPAATAYQRAIHESGIPAALFFVADVQQEYERLSSLGVVFTTKPTTAEWGVSAVFDDTCGNLIGLNQG